MNQDRRFFLHCAAASTIALLMGRAWAQAAIPRRFDPEPGAWRTFEVTTRVDIAFPEGSTQVWLPVPCVETGWQRSLSHEVQTNGAARWVDDGRYGVRMLHVRFEGADATPWVVLVSRVQTRNRKTDWGARGGAAAADVATLRFWTQPTRLLPTDGIVRETALKATRGARTDRDKVRALYDWVVHNTYREPKVRGCGEGDIRTMLETGNLGGKCADLNALFVGLCRAVGVPARDVYGLRLAPSAFGYKELGAHPANLKGAQHCRAEVYLAGLGWVAMDPADVAKVMRQETSDWIKDPSHPLVAPVNRALFGGWEGNWVGWNMGHDLRLPGAQGPELGFLMYPVAETGGQRIDSYTPDDFKYQISAREIGTA
jgi:transglutaminase-like putative cysteine protease